MWNQRYNQPDYVYGTQPNDFLHSVASSVPRGKVLSLGEGEGRNAIYLATLGFDVTAVDSSDVGLEKARRLAAEKGVKIITITADLGEYQIQPDRMCHLKNQFQLKNAKIHPDC